MTGLPPRPMSDLVTQLAAPGPPLDQAAALVRVLARWGFFELNLHRVQLKVYEDNARAIRAYEKAGFKIEGCLRQARFHEGGYHDTLVMGLLREELR